METKRTNYFSYVFEVFDDDYEMVIELSEDLLFLYQETIKKIFYYHQANDGLQIAKTAHKFKGAVINFHMDELVSILTELEAMGRKNDLVRFHQIVESINIEMLLFKEQLDALVRGS